MIGLLWMNDMILCQVCCCIYFAINLYDLPKILNKKIIEKGKIDHSNTPIHDCSLSWLGIVTSIQKWWKQ
jgi:hypothetical protein